MKLSIRKRKRGEIVPLLKIARFETMSEKYLPFLMIFLQALV